MTSLDQMRMTGYPASVRYAWDRFWQLVNLSPRLKSWSVREQANLRDVFLYIYVEYEKNRIRREEICRTLEKYGFSCPDDVIRSIFLYANAIYRDGWRYIDFQNRLENTYETERKRFSPRRSKLV